MRLPGKCLDDEPTGTGFASVDGTNSPYPTYRAVVKVVIVAARR